MPEKTLGKWLLEQFEKLEAEELQGAKEIAEMVRMTPKPQARSKLRKTMPAKMSRLLDPEQMETGDIEGPASGQITPGETCDFRYIHSRHEYGRDQPEVHVA